MFGRLLKSLGGGGAAETEGAPSPLGVVIGQPFFIDPLAVRLLGADSRLILPETSMIVAARGLVDLGDGSFVHRYYSEDNTMVQALTNGGHAAEHIAEVTLYRPLQSYYPNESDRAAWSQWEAKLKSARLALEDGTSYERVWFAETRGPADPVVFSEAVRDSEDEPPARRVDQRAMLFSRVLASGKPEFLLAAIETIPTGRSVELMVGMDLDRASLSTS
ncbi:Protein of unknown function [Arboricoccus pini]|uniref:DUF2491 domain-containing protein n=1 Tax=Arboricoccus pini TaxID=1963835 RepID=A0A212QMY0_9PROT|nr:DUF2491 family protein [Arboricoccus pini]SNB60676.1 Protein of unknown function [Arboricoccus pini]